MEQMYKKSSLSKQTIKEIRKSPKLLAELVGVTGKSYPTIKRWVDKNSKLLLNVDCLRVISESLGKSESELMS